VKTTEGLGAKYSYTSLQGESRSIDVWDLSGNKALRTRNEDIGKDFGEGVKRESEY